MHHISSTPFGRRPIDAAHLAAQSLATAAIPDQPADKWAIIRDLTAARQAFGVTDRDLAVLTALVSFHPGTDLAQSENTIVFPSNAALSARAHGMPESTLRRHLAALVRARLILRHDSPNGKRFARRHHSGEVLRAFGFDLRPLCVRVDEITQAAAEAYEKAAELRALRETIVLQLRDLAKMIDFGVAHRRNEDWTEVTTRQATALRIIRRKLDTAALSTLYREVYDLCDGVKKKIAAVETDELSGKDPQNERHIQYSNINLKDSEKNNDQEKSNRHTPCPIDNEIPNTSIEGKELKLPLYLVMEACPEIQTYGDTDITSWDDLFRRAEFIRPMMGISSDVWQGAQAAMGPLQASVVISAILQRTDKIRSPGAYLRDLTQKARQNVFSCGPMIMALLQSNHRRAA
ncbi:replication initiation protein RepC [Rhodobacteraceae bacterium]|nr:replication initiation protein RepC [Paracoccaceae bacterium]